jgi:hypothetical protein
VVREHFSLFFGQGNNPMSAPITLPPQMPPEPDLAQCDLNLAGVRGLIACLGRDDEGAPHAPGTGPPHAAHGNADAAGAPDPAGLAAGDDGPGGPGPAGPDPAPAGSGHADPADCPRGGDQPPVCVPLGAALSGTGPGRAARPAAPGLRAPPVEGGDAGRPHEGGPAP